MNGPKAMYLLPLESGCPVKGHPRPHISWFLNSQSLGSAAEITHQLLAEGQVLRLPNVTKHLHGEVRCLSENDAGTLQQRADLDIRGKSFSSAMFRFFFMFL